MKRKNEKTEEKFFDAGGSSPVSSVVDWSGTEVPCDNYIEADGVTLGGYNGAALIPSANGTGYGQVSGAKYRIRKIFVSGYLQISKISDQADVPEAVPSRIALVMDKNARGAQLQGEQVFTDMGNGATCAYSCQQQGQGTSRFKVLSDLRGIHNVSSTSTDGVSTCSACWTGIQFSFSYKPPQPLFVSVLTSGATPSVAQLKDINIFLLCMASRVGTITFVSRCYYEDC